MRPLRVLISTGIFPNRVQRNRGIYNLRLTVELRRLCDVAVVAPVPYSPGFVRVGAYGVAASVPREDDVAGFRVTYPRYLVVPKVARWTHGYTLYASVRRHYRRVAASFRPDVVLGFFAYPYGFGNVLIGRDLGVPVVTSCRGSDINRIARDDARRRRQIAWSLGRCARVLTVSAAMRDAVAALGVDAARVTVVPNGIDPERFRDPGRREARERLGLGPDGPVVVAVSRLGPEKGIDVLVEAAGRMRRRDARVVLVGDGPERAALERLAAARGVAGRVVFAGDRPHDEVPVWIGAADVTVLPSRVEGYPNAAVESLACGRPVVASRVGGVPEIVASPDLGILVPPEDPEALAGALDEALLRDWDPGRLREAGTRRTWATVAREVQEILESCVRGRAPEPGGGR